MKKKRNELIVVMMIRADGQMTVVRCTSVLAKNTLASALSAESTIRSVKALSCFLNCK